MPEHRDSKNVNEEHNLEGMKVAILVTKGFEQIEMTDPRKALENAGAKTHIICPKPGEVQGFDGVDKADTFKIDITLDQADPDDYDAVLLPGGTYNADKLRMDENAQKFIRKIDEKNKPIAAICHAPWLLVSAGLVRGRTLTSYYTLQDDIRNAGGRWLDKEVVRDHNWVSSRNPDDIPAFNREMVKLFAQHQPQRVRAGDGRR
jgi:protease I